MADHREHPLAKHPEIYDLAQQLVRACAREHLCLTGFIFASDPPLLTYIATVTETGPDLTALHLKLCDMYDDVLMERVTEMLNDASEPGTS